MARKRADLKKLDYQSAEYWNRLLADDGLSLEQGRHPKLLYVGDSVDLEYIEGARRTDSGRVRPKDSAE
jgi:hypothetical protein